MFSKLKVLIKALRKCCNFWVPEQSLEHLQQLRLSELESIFPLLPKKGDLLEIGAGTGWQSKVLAEHGYVVQAVDLDSSTYKAERVWPVKDYDGKILPYDNETFDIVFSSNVMEHIPHVVDFQSEIQRVLKEDGIVIHLIPSSSWRTWTNITQFIRYWSPSNVHGEHAFNIFTEIYYFSRPWWKNIFTQTGWKLDKVGSNRLFYTGGSIMDKRLGVKARKILSYFLGGSCSVYLMKESDVSIPLNAKRDLNE